MSAIDMNMLCIELEVSGEYEGVGVCEREGV